MDFKNGIKNTGQQLRFFIRHENIVQFMEIFIIVNYMLIISLFFRIFFNYLFNLSLAKLGIINLTDQIELKYWILGSLVLSIFIIKYIYIPKGVFFTVKLRDIDGISSYQKYLVHYSSLLLKFLINLGLFFIILSVFHNYFFVFGIIFLALSPTISIVLFSILNNIRNNLYYTINMAYNIFEDNIVNNNINYKSIYEFNRYFGKSIYLIDIILPNGVKIDDLKEKKNESLKYLIPYYLPAYIQYGSIEQMDSLRNHFVKFPKLIDKNGNIISLKITTLLSDIFQDIEQFLERNNYSITEQNWHIKMPSWAENLGLSLISIKLTTKESKKPLLLWVIIIILILESLAQFSVSINPLIDIVSKLISFIQSKI